MGRVNDQHGGHQREDEKRGPVEVPGAQRIRQCNHRGEQVERALQSETVMSTHGAVRERQRHSVRDDTLGARFEHTL